MAVTLLKHAFSDALGFIGDAQNHVSPLVLDLDGDGVAADLRHIYDDGAVFFDIDADGFAERVGWVGPDDGHLAMDRNGNGRIDDIMSSTATTRCPPSPSCGCMTATATTS